MMNAHLVLYVFAVVFFVLAAFPTLTAPRPVQLQWLACACLVLAQML
jgi:hypothetical protein